MKTGHSNNPVRLAFFVAFAVWTSIFTASCAGRRPGAPLERRGDEIMICGQLFHTGAPVVLWTDPGGYDAYRVQRRFAPLDESSWENTQGKIQTPERYGHRTAGLTHDQVELTRGGGWSLDLLRERVDQFVLHYDVCGTSRACFRVLHDFRGLSVHFMLDIDGTVYQTLDVKERAWHATIANDRSVGIEIANIGAYPPGAKSPLAEWYSKDETGRVRLTIPQRLGDGGVRTTGVVFRPARDAPVSGEINGRVTEMYDLTPQQYESLIKLTATLCTVLPRIKPECPRDEHGRVLNRTLTKAEFDAFSGVLGHFHIQKEKTDPGPAFNWDHVLKRVRGIVPDRQTKWVGYP